MSDFSLGSGQRSSAGSFGDRRCSAKFELDRLVPPKLFKVVVLADGGLHDVRNSSATIDDDPFAVIFTFNAGLAKACFTHSIANAGGQRLSLTVGCPGSDDHPLKQRSNVLCIKDLNVLRLDILQAIDDGALKFLDIFRCAGVGIVHAMLLKG